jgi:purine-binding chemotaxis protein CheW
MSDAYLTFRLKNEWYGIHIDSVIEVLHMVALNEVPASTLLGVMTLRKMVIPVVDLRTLFGIEETTLKLDTPIIAIRTRNGNAGIVVDEADEVVHVSPDQIVAHQNRWFSQVVRLDSKMLFLLDVDHIQPEGAYV